MKILLIEDEQLLADSILKYLQKENYLCEVAYDFDTASEKIALYQYDIIILDITLPGGNGLELLRQIKKAKMRASVIIISARNSVEDKILGLDLGADDYITKPFHLAELNARIKSNFRKRNFEGNKEIVYDKITLNIDTAEVRVCGEPILLTRKEYELLLYFINNRERIVTKEAIAEHLWGDNIDTVDSFDFIYTHIKNLRKKIMEKGGDNYIKTVYSMGYKFHKD
ncbi:MAG: response regulator transcription factor [Microscillaceae bacterium]|nr:response regulator transcription factor [Microscillaceae bacterium]MDW8461578.1 response regulator transcription factor [Cytophagales bacterium]